MTAPERAGMRWTATLEGGPFDGDLLRPRPGAPLSPPPDVWVKRSSDPADWGSQHWFTLPTPGTVHYTHAREEAGVAVYAFADLGVGGAPPGRAAS